MRCPYCFYEESKVVDTRVGEEGNCIRRRRECYRCKRRFTTYEKIKEIPLMVVKRDGRRELFNRSKILTGIRKACEKRQISIDLIDSLVDELEEKCYKSGKKEITASYIGQMTMEKLKELDDVAYLRFASVYKKFDTGEKFLRELQNLKKVYDVSRHTKNK